MGGSCFFSFGMYGEALNAYGAEGNGYGTIGRIVKDCCSHSINLLVGAGKEVDVEGRTV